MSRVLVFSRTKHGANRIVRDLEREQIAAAAIHGNKAQSARERALASFADGQVRVLVQLNTYHHGLSSELICEIHE